MENFQLYLVNVNWRAPNEIASIVPGKLQVPITFDPDESCFEANIPSYARENGLDMQLAVKSIDPCFITGPNGDTSMFEVVHVDTGDHWWVEKGPWERRAQHCYHDAPSFHRPGGTVIINVGGSKCLVHLYEPSIPPAEFSILLDDIKNWCWRMAIDESCYVTVGQDSEVRLLSSDFMRLTEDFIRHTAALLELPQSELRESIEDQRIDRLRPNNHSLRFLAQRGDRNMVPGRSAKQHYNTPENRFAYAMLKRVISMLRWTTNSARDNQHRFERTATQYEVRAKDLNTRTTERIDPSVLDEMLRRSKQKNDLIQPLLIQGWQMLKVTSEKGYLHNWHKGEYNNTFAIIELGYDSNSERIRSLLSRCGSVMVIGQIKVQRKTSNKTGNQYNLCSVENIRFIDIWRDYATECVNLEMSRSSLQNTNWEKTLPSGEREKRRQEGLILTRRAKTLREAAGKTCADAISLNMLFRKARFADNKATKLGITPDLRFIPTIVFLQSPAYAGALSAYRQLLSLAGVDETAMEGLLALEDVGLRDWPGIYERWCLVSLLRVLQDDFRFQFENHHVRECLLKYCTGQKPGAFLVAAKRDDMKLHLTLQYQAELPNRRIPDFFLTIYDTERKTETRCVLDAKACAFRKKPVDSQSSPLLFIDDCIQELVVRKDYGEGGSNSVFVLHASSQCIAQPTTIQSWATASAYGGDILFAWENERPKHRHGAVLIRPGEAAHLKRLILLFIQQDLKRTDICASCGSGGSDVVNQPGRGVGDSHKCNKCGFFSVSSHCYNCKEDIVKNQAWWTYHDLHPTDVWNIKCCACGSLL